LYWYFNFINYYTADLHWPSTVLCSYSAFITISAALHMLILSHSQTTTSETRVFSFGPLRNLTCLNSQCHWILFTVCKDKLIDLGSFNIQYGYSSYVVMSMLASSDDTTGGGNWGKRHRKVLSMTNKIREQKRDDYLSLPWLVGIHRNNALKISSSWRKNWGKFVTLTSDKGSVLWMHLMGLNFCAAFS
jgi:hypothetical protein